jgi:hypothetical protein
MGRKPSYSRLFPTLLLSSPKPNAVRRLSSVDSAHGPHHDPQEDEQQHHHHHHHQEDEEERCPKRRTWSPFRQTWSSEDMLLARDGTEKLRLSSSSPPLPLDESCREACPAEPSSSSLSSPVEGNDFVAELASAAAVSVSASASIPPSCRSPKKNMMKHHHRRRQSEPPVSSATFSQHQTERKSVRFGKCLVRSYSQVLGDHPCCATGCPLTLGWDYQEESVTAVVADEDYDDDEDEDDSEDGSETASVTSLGGVVGVMSASSKKSRSEELRLTYEERRAILSNVSDANIRRHCRQWQREQQLGSSRNIMKRLQQRVERDFFRHVPKDGEEEDHDHPDNNNNVGNDTPTSSDDDPLVVDTDEPRTQEQDDDDDIMIETAK